MKKMIIVAVGLMMMLTSCGEKQTVTEQQQTTEIKENSQEEPQEAFTETEIGAFDGVLYDYKDGMLIYSTKGEAKTGVLDRDGKEVLEPKYGYLQCGDDLFLEQANGEDGEIKWCYLNKDGEIVFEEINGLKIIDGEVFKDGYAAVTLGDATTSKRNYGEYSTIIDKNGNIIIEAEGDANYLSRIDIDGLVYEYNENDERVRVYNIDGTLASNDVLQEENYNVGNIHEIDGLYIIKDVEDEVTERYAIYDNVNKKELTGYDYLYYEPRKIGDYYLVTKAPQKAEDYNVVILDSQGKEVCSLAETYNYFNYPTIIDDKIILEFKGKTVVLNQDGSIYKETDYDLVFNENTYRIGDKIGFMKDYEKLTEAIYDDFSPVDENTVFATRDGKLYRLEFK